uniref:Uncharacterized protein n=1 Tax=Globodera rostochiensis TaxID=31243 RepID=A0A914HKX9_GLORO
MEELQNFTMWNLHQKLALDDDEFDEWLTGLGLLHAKRTCPACGGDCGIKKGIVCEIDETMAVRRKYERGRMVANDVWLFGGTEWGLRNNASSFRCSAGMPPRRFRSSNNT